MFTRLAENKENEEGWKEFYESYGPLLKLGTIEDIKNREKLGSIARFATNQRKLVTLDEVRASPLLQGFVRAKTWFP